ncbi:unnamed protein product [Caenorhabditis sp. 36 PRJEB53466]|nr:unnamed protein product [Caenorhabditis sp. 36 PRJEB53466]
MSEEEELLEEDKYGRLICRKYGTIHPTHEKLSKKMICEAFDDESPPVSYKSTSTDSPISQQTSQTETEVFVGGATEKEAEQLIGYRGFVIYYRMASDGTVQFSLPLMLAYRSTKNFYYHFTISKRKQHDPIRKLTRHLFRVEYEDAMDKSCEPHLLNPEFLSLQTMIKHYETFSFHDMATGALETFPVWRKD